MTATPPRADLRTLATHAAHDVDCLDGPNCHEDLTTDGRYGRYADAVLAAVLPEHRRMVLTEAADLAESMVKTWPGMGDQAKAGNEHLRQAARRIRDFAAAAPPAGLSATVPAGTAPAVPEEADGQRAGQGDALDRFRRCPMRASLSAAEADRDRLAAQVAHYQRVVEAAKAWYAACDPKAITAPDVRAAAIRLAAAVDVLPDAGTDQTEDETDVHL